MRNRIATLGLFAAAGAMALVGDVSAGDGPTPADIADLVDELRDPDAHVRDVARRGLVALGEKAVAPLVELLRSGETRGRVEAVAVLSALGPTAREAAPVLAERARVEVGAARLPFLRALGEVDPTGSAATAVPILLAFLDDANAGVRLEAATALRSFGPAASKFAPDVLERLSTADAAVRSALLDALRAMGVDAASVVVDLFARDDGTSKPWVPGLVNELGEAVVPTAVERLSSEDKAIRASAAQVLGIVGPAAKSAVPQLVAALKDPAGVVRRRAAEALGAIGADAKVALPALTELLADESSRAQVEAASAMGRVAVRSARPGDDVTPNTGAVDRAVEDGLDWLARHQFPSSGWKSDAFPESGKAGAVCDGIGEWTYSVGVTGLATLAFLGAGETHQTGEHRAAVQSALQWLRSVQDSEGCFGERKSQHFIYNHATAALAMTEAYRLTQSTSLKEPAGRAVQFILRARNPYLAWRYNVPRDGDNDTSVTGWMVRALASARRGGFDVDAEAIRGGLAWVDKMTEPEFGRTGYQQRGGPPARTNEQLTKFPADRSESLTAEGLCIRLDAGQDANAEIVRKGRDLLLAKPPKWEAGSVDLYYWFHGTDAMRRMGGAGWEQWRNALVAAVAPHQVTTPACARGSWAPDDPWGPEGGRVYSTSMAVLALEMCGLPERKAGTTPEVRAAIAALTKALESGDAVVRQAAQAALDDIRSAYR